MKAMLMIGGPTRKCDRLGCPEPSERGEAFCFYHLNAWRHCYVTPTIYYDAYYYDMTKDQGHTYETRDGKIMPILPGDNGTNGVFNPNTRRYEFMTTTAAGDNPGGANYAQTNMRWSPRKGIYEFSPDMYPPLQVLPGFNPLPDGDLEDNELDQVDRARVLGTAVRRFIETSGIDDPFVLSELLDHI